MAVETHTVIRCDICSAEGAAHCAIGIGRDRWRIDLCEAHIEPLSKLAVIATPEPKVVSLHAGSDSTERALDAKVRGLD